MSRNYIVIGIIAAGGIAFASSVYLFQDSEQKVLMSENKLVLMQDIQELIYKEEKNRVKSLVGDREVESEIIVDKVEDMLLPEDEVSAPHDIYDGPHVFWEADENEQADDPEVYALKVEPKIISNLQVGQIFDFYVPELNQTFQTDINVTKNSFNGTHIFKGEIKDGRFGENISIVRGKNMTFVTIATLQGVYSASIDNITGKSLLQSEASLNKNLHGKDGIKVEVLEIGVPELGMD